MGLKCSVLGHAYGETTVERDREERGSEVVITIRELETCARCGETRVVTENKEVTTIETQDDEPEVTAADAMAAMEGDGADAGEGAGETGDTSPSAPDDTSSASEAGRPQSESLVEDAEGGAAVTNESVGTPSPDAVEDQGAEILDDEGGDGNADDEPVDDELADPTIENDAEVPGDTDDEGDAVILDDEPVGEPPEGGTAATHGVGDEGATHGGGDEGATPAADADDAATGDPSHEDDEGEDPLGEWPEETMRDTEDDWTPSEEITGTVDDVDPDADVDREFSTGSAVTVPEGEFYCEGCGYTTPVEASSLRAGDFCPECHSETLVHRPKE